MGAKTTTAQAKSDTKPEAVQGQTVDLQQFTLAFFEFFGAEITRQGRKKQSPYQIDLPADLATHFGKRALSLSFQQSELAAGQELVTQGSRIFDRMIAYLEGRSALTVQKLPSRFLGSEELLKAIRPVNVGIAGLRMQEQVQLLFAFTWRITYRADDKREELYTVVLDESGTRLPQPGDDRGEAEIVDLAQLLSDAEPVPLEQNEEGHLIPPRLPPMTQLVRLAETARKYAIYHADLRCVTHEAEILPRLYKALNRLTTYYQQQAEEIYDAHDPTGEKRQALEIDLQRKIAEEVENHRLRVDLNLTSYAVIHVPVGTAEITLSDGKQESVVRVRRNRYNGALRRPACHACGEETTAIAIDRNGHITCDTCLEQCATCQELLCARCGVAPCPVCGKGNCDTCGQLCWACGERACAEHSSQCPICGDEVCHACQAECAHCGVRQCRSHLRADHVAAERGTTELICTTCATRCPGCQQYSAHNATCSASGQRFCERCLATCATCGQRFGPGFYQVVDGHAYCSTCLIVCPSCHAPAPTTLTCTACGETCCTSCRQLCAVCGDDFCVQHAQRMKSCEHVLCTEHTGHCFSCARPVCPICDPACGICERPFCPDHSAVCEQCGCTYCRECVRRSGLCDTCAMMHREGKRYDLAISPYAADPKVGAVARHYRWQTSSNEAYQIFVGESTLHGRMVVIVDRRADPPKVVAVRKVGPIEAFLGRGWR
jgi:hypothetical protein